MADKDRPEMPYVDNPLLAETFADAISGWHFDGHTLRMELLVHRMDEPRQDQRPNGRKVPVCRLVLSADGAVQLLNFSRQLAAALEQKGVVKTVSREPVKSN